MTTKNSITQSRLKEILHYDPKTGILTWKQRIARCIHIGDIAGCITSHQKKKYRQIRIFGTLHMAHRLVWLYMTGSFPKNEIDHADGNELNNKWNNLSDVTHQENSKNQRLRSTNTSGHIGIIWDKSRKKWRAEINVAYKAIYLGRFKDIEDAIKARKEAEKKYDFHPNHGSDRPL